MPAARHSISQASDGPIAQLLTYTEQILELESQLQRARILRRLFRLSVYSLFIGIFAVYIFNVLAWQDHKIKDLADWPLIILLIFMILYIVGYGFYKNVILASDNPADVSQLDVRQLELKLELAKERKRLHAASINLDTQTRQLIYRDAVPETIDQYRRESTYYRRVHNFLQAIIIIGALAGSTLTSLLQSVPILRWYAIATTFSVGVAAGFTGYFKFRERSFYLQQTSDVIDQEFSAIELGIGRYKGKDPNTAMTEFAEQVELLKAEQRKRQQQLEQPSEGREGTQ